MSVIILNRCLMINRPCYSPDGLVTSCLVSNMVCCRDKKCRKMRHFFGWCSELPHRNWLTKFDPSFTIKSDQLHGLEQCKISR